MRQGELPDEKFYDWVMTSEPHAKLFFKLAKQPDYTSKLAKEENCSLSTMNDMLSNLVEIGVITKLPKDGKIQKYGVDWDGVIKLCEKEFFILIPNAYPLEGLAHFWEEKTFREFIIYLAVQPQQVSLRKFITSAIFAYALKRI
jgi:hypothetical protein